MNKILIIEDDRAIRTALAEMLDNSGYSTEILTDFSDTARSIINSDSDLVLLDINIPRTNGEAILREVRKQSDIPVIMVTSRTSEADEVLSMSYGADDYITKPYNPTILLLRISAVLKRTNRDNIKTSYKGLKISTAKGSISDGRNEIILTKNEMIIFQLLLDRQGQIVPRNDIMTALWDNEEYINDNALTVNISRLRNKLSELGCSDAIETRKKQGYILL